MAVLEKIFAHCPKIVLFGPIPERLHSAESLGKEKFIKETSQKIRTLKKTAMKKQKGDPGFKWADAICYS